MSPEEGFLVALNKFKTRLTKDEESEFRFTSLHDVQTTIVQIQRVQNERQELMNFTRIQSFLEAMRQFGVVVEVFLNTTDFIAFVWGPLKFLLQTASAWSESFDTLLNAYQRIAEHIPLLLQFRSLFEVNEHMKHALGMMYEDILEFHRRALRVFTKSTWRQLFRATWKDFNATFDHILQNLIRHKCLIESQATLIHFQEARLARDKASENFKKVETEERRKNYLTVLDWISPTDVTLDQLAACETRGSLPETGLWILKAEEVKVWCQSDLPRWPKLWMYGIPGAGKTILASVVIQDCLETTGTTCGYFYCKHADPHRNSFLSLARTVLAQLLTQHRDLLPHFYDQLLSSGQSTLTSQKLCQEILQVALHHGQRTHVIIDGLDECNASERRTILLWFNSVTEACNKHNPGSLRVLFVSQDEPDIRKLLQTKFVRLTADNIGKDIALFVRHWTAQIQQKFEIADSDVAMIEKLICDKAEGMFLYAKLVVRNLYAQPSQAQLREELGPNRFPDGLKQAYERIIARIVTIPNAGERAVAQQLLGWMVRAKRPFKWHEIQAAISTDTVHQKIRFDERRLRIHVRDLCGSLIDVLPGDRVELVHWTAKSYINSQGFIHQGEVERSLTALSLQYLTFECFNAVLNKERLQEYTIQGYFAFQEYAVAHWTHHLESSIESDVTHLTPNGFQGLTEFGTAVSEFVSNYEQELIADESSEDDSSSCKQFSEYDWHLRLEILLRHVRRHQRRGPEASDKISINTLREAFFRNRKELERIAEELDNNSEEKAAMSTYYGINWFRCSKLSCDYFHEGFPDNKRREQHMNRHDRPFRCVYGGCSGSLFGFDSAKGLEKHIKNKHPPDGQIRFAKLKDSGPAIAEFKCEVCSSIFNRKFNLRTHMQTRHTGERPFKCSFEGCESAFARGNDRRRHEALHRGERKYVCGSNAGPDLVWGCGSRFARMEGLEKHFSSYQGRTCLEPLWQHEPEVQTAPTDKAQKLPYLAIKRWEKREEEEEEKAKEEWKKREEERKKREEEWKKREEERRLAVELSKERSQERDSGPKCNLTSSDLEIPDRLPPLLGSPLAKSVPLPRTILEQYRNFEYLNLSKISNANTPGASNIDTAESIGHRTASPSGTQDSQSGPS